ncbi:hypothetical protein H6F51_18140 [Cyanobacteria bacterium FACHB-DQ100]|nr:hypothetical protein [Cyanobacteria bacterium FACHB-DQ100]
MFAEPEFVIEVCDGVRLGRLYLPFKDIAEWMNFLLEPQQQSQIVLVQQHSQGISLYFHGSERIYAYLDGRFNCQVGSLHPETIEVGQKLRISS